MVDPVAKDFMDMKVAELKDELEARGASKSARDKPLALRVRLRALKAHDPCGARRAARGGGRRVSVVQLSESLSE